MSRVYTNKSEQEKRRILRSNMTKSEVMIWLKLKNKKQGERFLRQFSINRYVVNFYCPNLKLAIEIDGDSHLLNESIEYDKIRQTEIETLGIKFLGFTNEQIKNKLTDVIDEINKEIVKSNSNCSALPPI